jgi:hypothetical protein
VVDVAVVVAVTVVGNVRIEARWEHGTAEVADGAEMPMNVSQCSRELCVRGTIDFASKKKVLVFCGSCVVKLSRVWSQRSGETGIGEHQT